MAVLLLALDQRPPVRPVDALGQGDDAAPALLEHAVDVAGEAVEVEHALGHVDEVRAVVLELPREHARRRQPARVASHDHVELDPRQRAVVLVVADQGLRDELRGRAVARAVVGLPQVVVDRLRHVEEPHLVALRDRELVEDVRGLRGVVAADVEEPADLVAPERGEHLLALLARRLLAHRAQRRRGRLRDRLERPAALAAEVDEVAPEDPLDPVPRAVDAADALRAGAGLDDADQALVDHGGRSSGLTDQDVAGRALHRGSSGRDHGCGTASRRTVSHRIAPHRKGERGRRERPRAGRAEGPRRLARRAVRS